MTVEWSREQAERWPMETRVLLDIFIERDGVSVMSDDECAEELLLAGRSVKPYQMRTWDGSVFGLGPFSLLHAAAPSQPLTLGAIEAALFGMRSTDCPLRDCETFDFVQRYLPVAAPPLLLSRSPVVRVEQVQDLVEAGFISMAQARRLLDFPELNATIDLAVEDGDRTLLYQRVQLTQEQIEASQANGGGAVLTLGDGGQYQVVEERPIPTPAPPTRSRVPPHVARHRRRLDGRRA